MLTSPSKSRGRQGCSSHSKDTRRELHACSYPKRILLASGDRRQLAALTRRLNRLGHRVCTITSAEEGPAAWTPGLYDAVVFRADDAPSVVKGICEPARRADSRLLLVMLAREPFGEACELPDAVITESEESAIAERLLAIVNGRARPAA